MTDFTRLTLSEVSEKIRGSLSPVEVLHGVLGLVDRVDSRYHSFITVQREHAEEEARRAELEIRRGDYRGPLHGVPVSLKDVIFQKGERCTAGSKILADFTPRYDSMVVRKLRAAGAVIIGTNNLDEFASGVTNTNPFYGIPPNPWKAGHVAGGSSGGSCVAVSMGMSFGSFGTDTGGSVRIPAALCGVVGVKPTYGRVSKRGVIEGSWSLDHVGPIARTVRDATMLLGAVSEYDPRDRASKKRRVPDFLHGLEGDVSGMRVAVIRNLHLDDLQPDVERAFGRFLDTLSSIGVSHRETMLSRPESVRKTWVAIRRYEASKYHARWLDSRPGDYGELILSKLRYGQTISATEYDGAKRTATLLKGELSRLMKGYDAVVSPTTRMPSPRLETDERGKARQASDLYTSLTDLTILCNVTGFPAMSIPVGLSRSGLPIGMQIAARPWEETSMLRIAEAAEEEVGFDERPPSAG